MPQQVTVQLPNPVVQALDSAARELRCSRADVIRFAIGDFLEAFDDPFFEDADDPFVALGRSGDPAIPAVDWNEVRRELSAKDQGKRSGRTDLRDEAGPDARRRGDRPAGRNPSSRFRNEA